MGCDIHMYIEYRRNKETDYYSDFGGRINPGRYYYIFGLLSKGVRSDIDEAIEPKGLPENLAWHSREDAFIFINDEYAKDNDGKHCSLETAEIWAKYGSKIIYRDDKPFKIEHPDWHSHSWLSTTEYEQQINFFINKFKDDPYFERPIQYEAVLAAMKTLESIGGESRVVFWFDN